MCLLPNRPFVDKSLSPAMSDLRVHANLGLLPERKRPLSVFITSYGIQAVAVLLLIQFCVFAPVQVETSRKIYAYMAVAAETTPSAHPAHPKPQLKKPPAMEAARVRMPEPVNRLQAPEPLKVAFAAPAPVLPHVAAKPIVAARGDDALSRQARRLHDGRPGPELHLLRHRRRGAARRLRRWPARGGRSPPFSGGRSGRPRCGRCRSRRRRRRRPGP